MLPRCPKYVVALLAAAFLPVPSHAQSPPLTEQAAVETALRGQPALRAAQAEADMARARAEGARAQRRPQVSLNALAAASNAVNAISVPAVMPQAILMSQDQDATDVNAMAMAPLFTSGRLREEVAAAEAGAKAAEVRSQAARVQVAYGARARFAEWRAALAMAKVAAEALTAQEQATAVARELYEVGKIPQFDLLRNEAARAATQQQVVNAQAEVRVARARLAQALGVAEEGLPSEAAAPQTASLPIDPLATALASHPDLAASRQEVSAAEAGLRARQASYRPQLYAFGMVDALAPAGMGRDPATTVGVVAGLPLVTGGGRAAEVAEARAGVARAVADREAAELEVRAEVAEAQAWVEAARVNIGTAEAQVRSAQASYAVARERYAAGKGTVVESLDALRAQTEAQQNAVVAQTQYETRLADLYRAMGVVSP